MPRLAGLSGSLREGWHNAALLRAAHDLSLPGIEIDACKAVLIATPAFDAALHLTHEATRDRLRDLLAWFHDWTLRHPLHDARPTPSTVPNRQETP